MSLKSSIPLNISCNPNVPPVVNRLFDSTFLLFFEDGSDALLQQIGVVIHAVIVVGLSDDLIAELFNGTVTSSARHTHEVQYALGIQMAHLHFSIEIHEHHVIGVKPIEFIDVDFVVDIFQYVNNTGWNRFGRRYYGVQTHRDVFDASELFDVAQQIDPEVIEPQVGDADPFAQIL